MEPKFLSEISHKEWVLYEWLLIEEFGTKARWLKGRDRSPHEAIVAAEEWDFLQSIKDEED